MNRTLGVLAFLAAFAAATSAQAPDAAAIREITIGAAVPSGRNFAISLDERSIERAYPAWTLAATREPFRSVVLDVVSRKLAATFPDGPPPDAARPLRIEIRMKIGLGRMPEITIAAGC